jgi:hypothetical protein
MMPPRYFSTSLVEKIITYIKSATSFSRIFLSSACIFNCPNFWDVSFPSAFSLAFRAFQYSQDLGLLVSISTTSTTEKYQTSFSA